MGTEAEDLWRQHAWTHAAPACTLLEALEQGLAAASRRRCREAIRAGLVSVDAELVLDPQSACREGAALICDLAQGIPHHRQRQGGQQKQGHPFRILYEDAELVVIDKASGIISAPGGEEMEDGRENVLARLRSFWQRQGLPVPYLGVVHRIDAATSGCLVIARSRQAQRMLSVQFAGSSAGRSYTALVLGQPRQDSDTLQGNIGRSPQGHRWLVQDPSQGKSAITRFQVAQRFTRGCRVILDLETGRTHQIRIHMASIGCPILGDPLYSRESRGHRRYPVGLTEGIQVPRLMLHAHAVSFDHPIHGQRQQVEAPLPKIFQTVERQLKRPGRQT